MEEWRDVAGFEGLYAVSTLGNVKSLRSGKLLKPAKERGGYLRVSMYNHCFNKYAKIHRLVAIAFIPNPDGKRTINHIDGNKKNNCVENLEWATHSENIIHANKNGLRVVTEAQREAARQNGIKTCSTNRRKKRVYCFVDGKRQEFESAHEAARIMNGSATAIIRCCKGKSKTHKHYEWGYCDAD